MRSEKITPFLKWPGGKRWFVSQLFKIVPSEYNHYYEPFLGGGSVFFALAPNNATISDINADLINLYTVMRDNHQELKEYLIKHNQLHSKEYYYETRKQTPSAPIESAARFLYLNRTCYNGMYRVNQNGQFNVPIGTKDNCIYDLDLFADYSKSLKNAEILNSDFAPVIQSAISNDLVFVDPPYTSASKNTSFIKYNDKLFTWDDQVRLHQESLKAKERGAKIILTNANCKEIIEMYSDSGFYVSELSRTSSIAGKADKRSVVTELLITSFPQPSK